MAALGWPHMARRASVRVRHPYRPHVAPLLLMLGLLTALPGCTGSPTPKRSATATATSAPRQPALSYVALPSGFRATLFASGLGAPRFMAFGSDGSLFAANRNAGTIVALRDPGHTGRATQSLVVASGLDGPSSVVYAQGVLYVGENSRISRIVIPNSDSYGMTCDEPRVAAANRGAWRDATEASNGADWWQSRIGAVALKGRPGVEQGV